MNDDREEAVTRLLEQAMADRKNALGRRDELARENWLLAAELAKHRGLVNVYTPILITILVWLPDVILAMLAGVGLGYLLRVFVL